MQFYAQYPMMAPYVGKRFHEKSTPSILLIGESHYLEDDCPQRRPDLWYSGTSADLDEEQICYIDNIRLLEESIAEGFTKKSHVIFKNAFTEINSHGPQYSDYRIVADDIAFYNFFLRPAVDGGSIKDEVTDQDIRIANEAFAFQTEKLKPSAVVFLSRFAFSCCNHSLSISVIATPHPGREWWNREAAAYGGKMGREILAEYIKTTSWPRILESS